MGDKIGAGRRADAGWGADGVLLGRAWAYALAARGEAGVTHVLQLVKQEMRVAMALTVRRSIAQIDANVLA